MMSAALPKTDISAAERYLAAVKTYSAISSTRPRFLSEPDFGGTKKVLVFLLPVDQEGLLVCGNLLVSLSVFHLHGIFSRYITVDWV